MKVIVKARHMDLTAKLRAHAEEKLGKAIAKIFDKPAVRVEIELSDQSSSKKTGDTMECHVTVSMPKGKPINISEVTDDMYKSIDLAHDRLLMQVKRQRDKKLNQSRVRKNAKKERAKVARDSMTGDKETWEDEVREYERSTASG